MARPTGEVYNPVESAQFSSDWYEIFLDRIPREQTEAEVAFIARHLPLASHPSVLDVCCGPGRHANALAQWGYRVLGVDTNAGAVAHARGAAPVGASFQVLDMRDLESLSQTFDGVLNLWASFGYFDDATNEAILRRVAEKLRPGGRAIIDIYNRDHMLTLPAEESAERDGVTVRTKRRWLGSRLNVQLEYGSGAADEFEWRLYTPTEFSNLANAVGLQPIVSCAWFDESKAPSAEHARMQFVLAHGA
jgi:SAM-dependent methyltransferase